jgi:hypothetical protein
MEPEGGGDGGRQIFFIYTLYILKYDTEHSVKLCLHY